MLLYLYTREKLTKQSFQSWTKHIYEDVQPFTCTFENCREPKTFKRKSDWIRHENERHRHLEWWVCQVDDCRHPSFRKGNFLQHLIREHKLPEPKQKTKAAIKRARLTEPAWVMLEQCHHETTRKPQDEPCKFCRKSFPTWKKLTVHLANHMLQFSLSILQLVEQQATSGNTISPIASPVKRVLAPIQPMERLSPGRDLSKNAPFGHDSPDSRSIFPLGYNVQPASPTPSVDALDGGFGSGDYSSLKHEPNTPRARLGASLPSSASYYARSRRKSLAFNFEGIVNNPLPPSPQPRIPSQIDSSTSGEMIRTVVLEGLRETSSHHRTYFSIHWDLRAFIREQYENQPVSIGSIITLSGSAIAAQATTCKQYIEANWPLYGSKVLQLLEKAIDSPDNASTCKFSYSLFCLLSFPLNTFFLSTKGGIDKY